MKKLLFISVVLLSGLAVTSCFKNDYEEDPTTPGQYLYLITNRQNAVALDAANIAFKFNLLLAEARLQEVGIDDVEVTAITGDESGTAGGEKKKNLKSLLFGDNKITESEEQPGNYTIEFEEYAKGEMDDYRIGSIIINTADNTLLGDLANGQSWYIYSGNEGKDYAYILQIETYYGSDYCCVGVPTGGSGLYMISGTSTPNEWQITISNMMSYYKDSEDKNANWNLDLTVKQNAGGQSYNDIVASSYAVDGEGWGKVLGAGGTEMGYDITDKLVYKSMCRNPSYSKRKSFYPVEGSERFYLTVPNPELYPSPKTDVTWKNQSDCINYFLLRYDGWVYNSYNGSYSQEGGTY